MATRSHYILLAVAVILLLFGLARQHDQVINTIPGPWQNPQGQGWTGLGSWRKPRPSFKEVALTCGTDKVTTHSYWPIYEKYLEPIRDKKIKLLEIGLGCDMAYGPGKSYYTWLEFFPNVDLWFIEYDAVCAAQWSDTTTGATIIPGDQADREFLRNFAKESGGQFDIIIDDGGHNMIQQQTSLEELWHIVKPGGMYFVEDLQTSFMPQYGGDDTGSNPNVHTMIKFIYELIDDMMVWDTRHPISTNMRSIDCMREICGITKKDDRSL